MNLNNFLPNYPISDVINQLRSHDLNVHENFAKNIFYSVSSFPDINPVKINQKSYAGYININAIETGINPAWMPIVRKEIFELTKLTDNWDGEGALPVSVQVAEFSIYFLQAIYTDVMTKAPAIVPLYSGDMQIEWRDDNYYIVSHIIEPNRIAVMRSIIAEKRTEYGNISDDFNIVKTWLIELFSKHNSNKFDDPIPVAKNRYAELLSNTKSNENYDPKSSLSHKIPIYSEDNMFFVFVADKFSQIN